MASTLAATLLDTLGWSTTQGDAALAGATAAEAGEPLSACPWSQASTLAYPWNAGWIATSVQAASPPTLPEARASGHLQVVLKANGAAASVARSIDLPSVVPPG